MLYHDRSRMACPAPTAPNVGPRYQETLSFRAGDERAEPFPGSRKYTGCSHPSRVAEIAAALRPSSRGIASISAPAIYLPGALT